jgi:CTP:molybdopterin cytidylyltransferase MocA
MFEKLMSLQGDEGARSLLGSSEYHGAVIDEPLKYRFTDIDSIEDVERIMNLDITIE